MEIHQTFPSMFFNRRHLLLLDALFILFTIMIYVYCFYGLSGFDFEAGPSVVSTKLKAGF